MTARSSAAQRNSQDGGRENRLPNRVTEYSRQGRIGTHNSMPLGISIHCPARLGAPIVRPNNLVVGHERSEVAQMLYAC